VALPPSLPALGGVYRSRPALVHAGGLGFSDPLQLALAAEVRLELGEHAQHVEEALAGGGAGVDRLFGHLKLDATGPGTAIDMSSWTSSRPTFLNPWGARKTRRKAAS
jgi:hypothetical protein